MRATRGKPVRDRRGPAAVTGDEGCEKPLPGDWREGAAGGRSGSQKTCRQVRCRRVPRGERDGGDARCGLENGGPGPDGVIGPGFFAFGRPKGGVMQAVVIREVGAFELADLPVPEPGPGEALIRVSVTGLCRTDLKIVRHGHRDLTLPRVPGEEVVGEIVGLGPEGSAAARPAGAAGPAHERGRARASRRVTASTCTPASGAASAPVAGAAPRTSAGRCASWASTATAASPSTSRRRCRA